MWIVWCVVAVTVLAVIAVLLRWLMRKPCSLCKEGVPQITWGAGHKGHYHPRTGQLVECHSLRPVTMREDS